jgi:hypothetical protein
VLRSFAANLSCRFESTVNVGQSRGRRLSERPELLGNRYVYLIEYVLSKSPVVVVTLVTAPAAWSFGPLMRFVANIIYDPVVAHRILHAKGHRRNVSPALIPLFLLR